MPKAILDLRLNGIRMGIQDMQQKKELLDDYIENEKYGELSYLYATYPKAFPIACSTEITPDFTYNGTPFNNHTDPDENFSPIMLTVLPDHDSTIIILTCFPEDDLAMQFLDELDELYPHQFKKAVSSLMITYAENTFFSPKFWNGLSAKKKNALLNELNENPITLWESFRISAINFFE